MKAENKIIAPNIKSVGEIASGLVMRFIVLLVM